MPLTFFPTDSATFARMITDETGTGLVVFNASPTLVTPTLGSATATFLGIGIGTTPDIAGTLLHARSNSTTVVDAGSIAPKAILSGAAPRNVLSLSTTYSTDVSNGLVAYQDASGIGYISAGNGTLATSNRGGHFEINPSARSITIRPGSGAGHLVLSAINDPTNGTEINALELYSQTRTDTGTNYGNFNLKARVSDGTNSGESQFQQLWEMTWTNAGGFSQDLFGFWDASVPHYAISMYKGLPQTVRIGVPISGMHWTLQANGPIDNADPTTRTVSTPLYNGSQTWNDASVTFTGIKANFTSTASAAASMLMDLQVGAASKFSVRKDGQLTLGTPLPISSGGTGATTLAGANIAVTTGKLSQFAATSSSELAGVISDETGSGLLVFATSPSLTTPLLGTPTSGNLANCTGYPASALGGLGTGVATFLATPSSANLASAVTDETGSGLLVFATSPTLTTPTLGVATATSINKVAITAPASSATLTIADGKTLTVSNILTFTGTDSSSIAFGAGGTVAYTANKLSAFAATSSSELAGVISDETGSGALVFATSPSLVTPTLGVATATSVTAATFTRNDGGTGTVPKLMSAQVGSSDTITASVVGTTETAFATTYTIPANTIGSHTVTRITLVTEYTASGSALTAVLKGKLGGTIFYQSNTTALAGPATAVGGTMQFILQGTAAPGAAVNVEAGGEQGFLYANVNSQNVQAQPVAFATNGTLALSFTITFSANTAGNSITLRQLIVEHY